MEGVLYLTVAGSTGLLGAHEHRFMTKIFGKLTLRSSICSCSSMLPHIHVLLGSASNIGLLISLGT